ncbi:hypothetical protein NEUTE1DRAFT_116384 [Neurospora tetrasperma FGSC 2508]|uniref:Uncharacterized protein n=1 Tax=Neurospora tetrasperma (strain FGSC 2508 / ATCC MYA-4615 / P0657) TaxID=510951 RepID=F8MJ36_NEUT8|nr:uncharacterized protein NEUTE1DRAFT_116384 [Neurospora tetrasperma FGSC 2508]EGO59085.1 hypothetical protein NEUTE1DRAFT_116384 [Neurospora tetrasperma FGSC 2508]EGZ73189.1 hypothetical protein NEUTE2DRAFT_144079 [Neurospora tetrasperma FGSC 2509]
MTQHGNLLLKEKYMFERPCKNPSPWPSLMGGVYGILIHPPLLLAEKRGDRCLDSGST